MTRYEQLSVITAIISAVITLSAVVVALHVGVTRDLLRQPRLTMRTYDAATPDYVALAIADRSQTSIWLRVRVTNSDKGRSASAAQIMIVELQPDDAHADRQPYARLSNRFLKWSEELTNATVIPPGITRRIDVVGIRPVPTVSDDPANREATPLTEPALFMAIYPASSINKHYLPWGSFFAIVAICAQDTPAHFYRLHVKVDPNWSHATDPWPPTIRIERMISLGRRLT